MFFILSSPRSMLPNTFRLEATVDILLAPAGFSGVAKIQSSFFAAFPRLIGVLSRPLSTERDGDSGLLDDIGLKEKGFVETLKVKVGYSLTSAAQTTMIMSAKLARLLSEEKTLLITNELSRQWLEARQ